MPSLFLVLFLLFLFFQASWCLLLPSSRLWLPAAQLRNAGARLKLSPRRDMKKDRGEEDKLSNYQENRRERPAAVGKETTFNTIARSVPFRNYLTAPIISIASIYLTQGLLGLTSLARTFLLKDSLGLDPSAAAALGGVFVIPWTIKPLYGIVTDTFPLFGSRRKSYLILGGLGAALSNLLLSFPSLRLSFASTSSQLLFVLFCAILSSGCIAMTDVVADSIVVEETRRVESAREGSPAELAKQEGSEEGEEMDGFQIPLTGPNLQSLCWGAAAVGGILSSYSSGELVDVVGPEGVYRWEPSASSGFSLSMAKLVFVGSFESFASFRSAISHFYITSSSPSPPSSSPKLGMPPFCLSWWPL